MIIKHDITGLFQTRQMKINGMQMDKVQNKLASGVRINNAGDDASGLAVSEKMRSQIRGLSRANLNAQDGISFIETTDGFLSGISSMLQRLRELAVQAANGVYTNADRAQIQVEISALVDEIDRIASHAQFNGLTILTGKFSDAMEGEEIYGSMWFHVGANMDQRERIVIGTITAKAMGIKNSEDKSLSVSSLENANNAIGVIDSALTVLNKQRADLGAYYNRLFYTSKGLSISAENTQSSESIIRDADMAKQMISYVKYRILDQTNIAVAQKHKLVKTDALLYLLYKS